VKYCFALYESETWTCNLSEEQKLQMSENKMLGKVCGPTQNNLE